MEVPIFTFRRPLWPPEALSELIGRTGNPVSLNDKVY
jgi:hypothetical protein